MKLLLITAIAEFEDEVKQILKKAEVATYSFKEVTSYRDASNDAIETNWFGVEMNESESVLFYAFVPKENVDLVFELVASFNAKQETLSHIQAVVIAIEKSI